jgi:hypothetical protein
MPLRLRAGRWQRKILSIAKILALVILATTVLGALYISLFLSDDIKARALSLISQSVKTEISMSEPELDLLTEFPYASLRFNDVKCRGVSISLKANTLFTARRVSLLFSVWDFLLGHIAFKKISLEEGTIHLLRNESGKANWEIFNLNELPSDRTRRAIFSIQRIDIRNFGLIFSDHYLNNHAALRLKSFELAGNLKNDEPNVIVEASFDLDSMRLANGLRPTPAEYHLLASLEANMEDKIYFLKTCRISGGNDRLLTLSGQAKNVGQEGFWVQTSGTLLMFRQKPLENYLPTYAMGWPDHLTLSGDVKINFHAEGLAGPRNSPSIHMNFSFENGRILLSQQPERIVMYGIAKGNADWQEGTLRFRVPMMALSSQNGTRIRASIRHNGHSDHTSSLQVKGKITATDLWSFISSSPSQGIRGVLNTTMEFHFKNLTLSSVSGKLEFQDINFPLWNGTDSLELSRGRCLMRNNKLALTIDEGRLFGENFRGLLLFRFKNGDFSGTEEAESSFLECERLNLSNVPDKFWSQPLFQSFLPSDLLRFLPLPLRVVSDQLTYGDVNARDVEALFCRNSDSRLNVYLRGALCGGRISTLSTLQYFPSQRLQIYTTGSLSAFQPECLTAGLRTLFPQHVFPDLVSEGTAFHFRRLTLASPKTQVVRHWHTEFQGQSGTVSGSIWLNDLAWATRITEWQKMGFQSLHYEAWGDSSATFEVRAELRQKNLTMRLIQSPLIQAQELDLSDALASRIKSQGMAGNRLHELRDEGGRLYVPLYRESFPEDFSSRVFREVWLQRPLSPAKETTELFSNFPDECPPLQLSPNDTLLTRKKRRR